MLSFTRKQICNTRAHTYLYGTHSLHCVAGLNALDLYSCIQDASSPHPIVAAITQHLEYIVATQLNKILNPLEERVGALETASASLKQYVSNVETTMKRHITVSFIILIHHNTNFSVSVSFFFVVCILPSKCGKVQCCPSHCSCCCQL